MEKQPLNNQNPIQDPLIDTRKKNTFSKDFLKDNKFRRCMDISLFILTWITFIYILFFPFSFYLTLFFISLYLFYCTNSFKSPEWEYLNNILDKEQFKERIVNYFLEAPKINFSYGCYHYPRNVKRYIKQETEEFEFYSSRDVSGIFNLNLSKTKSSLVELNVQIEIEFDNVMSLLDFYLKKQDIINKNEKIDEYFKLKTKISLENYHQFTLVNLEKNKPFWLNKYFFIAIVILPFVELYKIYFHSKCAKEEFTIKKIISTRNNINNLPNSSILQERKPKFILDGGEIPMKDKIYINQKKSNDNNYQTDEKRALEFISNLRENTKKYSSAKIDEIMPETLKLNSVQNERKLVGNNLDKYLNVGSSSTQGFSALSEKDILLPKN